MIEAHDIAIAPTCGDPTIQIACPGGQPMDPAPTAHVVGSNLGIQDLGANDYQITLDLGISTPDAIPVSGTVSGVGVTCDVTIDTTAGSYSTASLDGRLSFLVNAQTGVTVCRAPDPDIFEICPAP